MYRRLSLLSSHAKAGANLFSSHIPISPCPTPDFSPSTALILLLSGWPATCMCLISRSTIGLYGAQLATPLWAIFFPFFVSLSISPGFASVTPTSLSYSLLLVLTLWDPETSVVGSLVFSYTHQIPHDPWFPGFCMSAHFKFFLYIYIGLSKADQK